MSAAEETEPVELMGGPGDGATRDVRPTENEIAWQVRPGVLAIYRRSFLMGAGGLGNLQATNRFRFHAYERTTLWL